MRRFAILLGLVLALGAGLCGAQDAAPNPLDGKTFRSLEKLPLGEKKGSVVQGHWEIRFKGKSYSWRYTDVVATGSYAFDAKTGALTLNAGKGRIKASFDAKNGVLTWDKRKYKAMNKRT